MTRPKTSFIWIAVLASTVLHGLAYLFFGWTWSSAPGGSAGTVSVDFIEPVVHEAAVETKAPSRTRRVKASTPQPKTTTSATSAPTSSAPPTASPVPGAGTGNQTNQLVAEIARLINERKLYPRAAVTQELEGRVVVAITLARDGSLVRAEVEQPCPFAILNDAALSAVRMVRRFPPLPPSGGDSLHLHVPIVFKIARR